MSPQKQEKVAKKTRENEEKSSQNNYDPHAIELYWQSKWEKENTYQTDIENASKPFYNLMMFPYPSAEGLHVGNVYTFGGIDAYGRFKRMQGYDVFQPIGLDGFGIHSENFAIKVGRTPQEHARISEEHFYNQLHMIGNAYDWSRTVETYKPNYYKWTQALFIELFKAGLAYKQKAQVNFCPSCKTVLSDEQVIDGKCERCNSVVEKKELSQWFFRITDYAERLLANTEMLDWTEKVKIAQKNWIGKKSGINITYKVEKSDMRITVFTTRPDTNFGATFIALAPENPLALELATTAQKKKVEEYIKEARKKSAIDRQAEGREKTGVFTGAYAINDLNGYKMPIWVSDFVLGGFGTGALVGVPAHDKRDFEFAQMFGFEVKRVVVGKDGETSDIVSIEQVQEEEGIMINSGFLDGIDIHAATEKIMDYMEEKGYGKRVVTYHLRDWLISRQRYWGPPIPMIYCEKCAGEGKSWFTSEEYKVSSMKYKVLEEKGNILNTQYSILDTNKGWYPEENLPVLLPEVEDFKPMGTGKAPLANYPEFYKTSCPECGAEAMRETDVSDTFLDSAWYFFRYTSTDIEDRMFDVYRVKKWLPVTSYIGGAEHAVLHLLYSRFITMVLKDLGYIDFEEPYKTFRANGLIIKDGAKMSKSKGNVINPDDYVKKFGADTLRTYLGFIGPFTQGGDFQDTGIEGVWRFLNRVWKLVIGTKGQRNKETKLERGRESMMHKTIKGVTEDMDELRFNTAIAKIMTYYNYLSDKKEVSKGEIEVIIKLLAPFAPHMAEELWKMIHIDSERMNTDIESIHLSSWPVYDPAKIVSDTVIIAVQVNGKLRDTLEWPSEKSQEKDAIEAKAKELANTKKYLGESTIKKVIYVPGKILNFVI